MGWPPRDPSACHGRRRIDGRENPVTCRPRWTSSPPTGDLEYAVDQPWNTAARLGVWFHPPRRVVTGRRARIRWWHRVRAAVLLAVFVVGGGIALATVVGVTIFLSGFLVEQAIG